MKLCVHDWHIHCKTDVSDRAKRWSFQDIEDFLGANFCVHLGAGLIVAILCMTCAFVHWLASWNIDVTNGYIVAFLMNHKKLLFVSYLIFQVAWIYMSYAVHNQLWPLSKADKTCLKCGKLSLAATKARIAEQTKHHRWKNARISRNNRIEKAQKDYAAKTAMAWKAAE